MGNQPKILNLDELEGATNDVVIKHKGEAHHMKVLDVDGFIAQQKTQLKREKLEAEAKASGDTEMASVLELIRDSIQDWFPTLPVGQLPAANLFVIFAWLNEMSEQLNQTGAPDSGEGITTPSAEGNAEAVQS